MKATGVNTGLTSIRQHVAAAADKRAGRELRVSLLAEREITRACQPDRDHGRRSGGGIAAGNAPREIKEDVAPSWRKCEAQRPSQAGSGFQVTTAQILQ